MPAAAGPWADAYSVQPISGVGHGGAAHHHALNDEILADMVTFKNIHID